MAHPTADELSVNGQGMKPNPSTAWSDNDQFFVSRGHFILTHLCKFNYAEHKMYMF